MTEEKTDTAAGSFKYIEICFNIDDVEISIHYEHSFNTKDAIPQNIDGDSLRLQHGNIHTHPYCEVFFCDSAPLEVETKSGVYTLLPDDVLLISPGHEHTLKGTDIHATSINFSFKKNKLYCRGGLFDILKSITAIPFLHLTGCRIPKELIKNYIESLQRGRVLMVSRYFHDILAELISAARDIPQIAFEDMLPDTNIRRHRSIEALIDRHYTENLTLELLAGKLNLSTRQTSRTVKAQTGKTLGELVLERRMTAALRYLTESELSVSAIATAVGYNSQTCFYNAFKKYYGRLPSEFRRATTVHEDKI